jgi:ATP-dependent DNA ligase
MRRVIGAGSVDVETISLAFTIRDCHCAPLPHSHSIAKKRRRQFDAYRALAIKSGGKVQLRSRNDNDFTIRYPGIVKALTSMPDETVIDGELVALDDEGRPSFNSLQNHGPAAVLLVKRRTLIEKHVLPGLTDPIRYSPVLEGSLENLILSVKAQGLEGLVAKRRDSRYESGLRTGAWQKMRVNRGQELVIAGYTPSLKSFDALVIGYYEDAKLLYAARTRSGFTTHQGSSCLRGSSHWK